MPSQLFYVDGRLLDIPNAYWPKKELRKISIAAVAPDFEPAQEPGDTFGVSAEPSDRVYLSANTEHALSLPPIRRMGDLSEVRMNEHGLTVMYRLDDRGEPDIIIACDDDRQAALACWHRFRQDGQSYVFRHGQDLIDLFRSFEVPH